jgi:hypothetical protein
LIKGTNEDTTSSYSGHQQLQGRGPKQSPYTKGIGTSLNTIVSTKQPYLGVKQLDIHKFNGESLSSDNDQGPESSDKEPTAPRPQSDSSRKEELTQRYAPPVEATTMTSTTPGATDAYYREEP